MIETRSQDSTYPIRTELPHKLSAVPRSANAATLNRGVASAVPALAMITFPVSELLQMFDEVRAAVKFDPEHAPKIVDGIIGRIVPSHAAAAEPARGGLAPWQKLRVQRFLAENLERHVPMSGLAALVKLSVSHFCRAFKKSFGETPHAYILRLRLELAQKLMLTTDDPLSQIALSCGLADQAHLSKLFRRRFHDTPNAWRRRNLTGMQVDNASLQMRIAA